LSLIGRAVFYYTPLWSRKPNPEIGKKARRSRPGARRLGLSKNGEIHDEKVYNNPSLEFITIRPDRD